MTSPSTGGFAKISVSAALPATFDHAGYEALTFTDVPAVPELPQRDKLFSDVEYPILQSSSTGVVRGAKSPVEINLSIYAENDKDAGYVIFETAFAAVGGTGAEQVALKIENPSRNRTEYYTLTVMGNSEGEFTLNSTAMLGVMLKGDGATAVLVKS